MAEQDLQGVSPPPNAPTVIVEYTPSDEYRWTAGFLLVSAIVCLVWALIAIWPTDARSVPTLQQQQKILDARAAIDTARKQVLALTSTTQDFQKQFDELKARIDANNKILAEEQLKIGQSATGDARTGCLLIYCPGPEGNILLLAAIAGALGSAIHAATALSVRIGVGQFDTRWTLWYVLRMPIGAALAVLFFCIVRAGFLNQDVVDRIGATAINPYGVTAVSALAGMFSRVIMEKLALVVDTLFAPKAPVATKPADNGPSCAGLFQRPVHGGANGCTRTLAGGEECRQRLIE